MTEDPVVPDLVGVCASIKQCEVFYGYIHSYTIQLSNGQKIQLPGVLKNITHLGTMIEVEIAHIWLPKMMSAYQNGDPIHFGPLTVNQSGLDSGRKLIPWTQIHHLLSYKKYVVVEQQGIIRKLSVKVEDVPNAGLLERIVNQIATAKNSTKRSLLKAHLLTANSFAFSLQKNTHRS